MSTLFDLLARPHWETVGLSLILCALIAFPLIHYVAVGWLWKKNDIVVSLTRDAKILYLQIFQKQERPDEGDVDSIFENFYARWYGRRHYVWAMAILIALVFCQGFLLIELGLDSLYPGGNRYLKIAPVAAAAFAGAYIFVASDFIARDRRRDLAAHDILMGCVRLSMAIVIGYAFADLVNEGIGVFMAFAVGVFPISGLQMLFRRLATRQLTIEEDADSRADQIIKLSGIDSAVSDRINSAGVTTIAQLAYCDPIQLAMQTNLTFSYIVDLVSQALAWVYLEERLAKIRGYGLRGALEIRTFSAELASDDPLVHQPARAALARIAEAADLPEEGLRVAFVQIAKDPYTEFLAKCW